MGKECAMGDKCVSTEYKLNNYSTSQMCEHPKCRFEAPYTKGSWICTWCRDRFAIIKSNANAAGGPRVVDRRRRMSQREFSDRRDSPVMVRLLQQIIDAQDK